MFPCSLTIFLTHVSISTHTVNADAFTLILDSFAFQDLDSDKKTMCFAHRALPNLSKGYRL
jgi:hypothetical protein